MIKKLNYQNGYENIGQYLKGEVVDLFENHELSAYMFATKKVVYWNHLGNGIANGDKSLGTYGWSSRDMAWN